MKIIRGRVTLVAATLVVGMLASGCGVAENEVGATPDSDSSSEGRSTPAHQPTPRESPDPGAASQRPMLVQDGHAPVADDLERLAESFVSYAVGDSNAFPHWESVSMSLGGEQVVSIDNIAAALSTRRIWKICPG